MQNWQKYLLLAEQSLHILSCNIHVKIIATKLRNSYAESTIRNHMKVRMDSIEELWNTIIQNV